MSRYDEASAGAPSLKTGAETYSSAIADAKNYMAWLIGQFQPFLQGRILEIGVGHASYATLLREHGDYMGVDLDLDSVSQASARYPGMRFAQCDILNDTALHALLPEGVDAVVSLNVFEHIENDARALANVVDILKPGGHLLIAVPALMMLYNELDRLAGHCRRYTKAGLRTLLDDEPVEIIKLNYMNAVGGLGWWVNSFSRPSSLNENGINQQIRIFDRYIVPVSKALDPLFRQYFGQSLICIARRL